MDFVQIPPTPNLSHSLPPDPSVPDSLALSQESHETEAVQPETQPETQPEAQPEAQPKAIAITNGETNAIVNTDMNAAANLEIELVTASAPPPGIPKIAKAETRSSLKASTWDGIFATIYSEATGGVLRTNFLIDLSASPTQLGLVASIPLLANLLQPLGAYLSERTNSRHLFCLWVYGPARLIWLVLAIAIVWGSHVGIASSVLINVTVAIAILSYGIGALGSAPWLSWMAVLVPRQLRGRYFGLRNSAANLTNLIAVPVLGFMVSRWMGGTVQGYGLVLGIAVLAGIISLTFQNFMADVNPQALREATRTQYRVPSQAAIAETGNPPTSASSAVLDIASPVPNEPPKAATSSAEPPLPNASPPPNPLPETQPTATQKQATALNPQDSSSDTNLLLFLLFFGAWTFAFNLSAPFFNLYLLDQLKLDISQVTLYNSLMAGANLAMLLFWGKLADRIGNRLILLGTSFLMAILPICWLITGANQLSVWLWFPLLHIVSGGTWAAIDLCSNNLQIGIAPWRNQSTYFGLVAAIGGICGALGTTGGGFLVQFWGRGLFGLFLLSAVLRIIALTPLLFMTETKNQL